MRFPEFTEEWNYESLDTIAPNITSGRSKPSLGEYNLYGSTGIIGKTATADYSGDMLLVARVGANAGSLQLVNDSCGITDNTLIIKPCKLSSHYLYFYLQHYNLNRLVFGSGQPLITAGMLKKVRIPFGNQLEQKKIENFLCCIDERITTQNKIIEKLETLIKGIRHNVFQQLRKDVGFNSTIGDILSFEQPQRYIVSSTEYSDDSSCTPVLTANKAFILGYTTETDGIYSKGDCIIIDDFTLDCKYVSFPFKIKSSAIKILTAENKYILRFIYEYLKSLDISTEEHKRHYITEIQPSSCILPDDKTLTTIALMFESITNKLENEQSLALMLNKQKQYLLSKMFI